MTRPAENTFQRLRRKINRGDSWLTTDLGRLFTADKLGDDAVEHIEERLLLADAGVEASTALGQFTHREIMSGRVTKETQLREVLHDALLDLLVPCDQPLVIPTADKPFVIFVVGVNGVGKTTTIGKLAARFRNDGHRVLLAAGDTFRAAATEQLTTWSQRTGAELVTQGAGADPASVAYDAVQAAQKRGIDIVIVDTAGRLHTQAHLMDELRKIKRVVQKLDPAAPHEVLLVLDATTGANALNQAQQFHAAVGVTGLAVTKLDGTAKGGVLLAIAKQMKLPVRFVGIGEGVDDLLPFNAKSYVEALVA
ncbi:MAG: signal recognition particle-docking protein FtsY [Nevskiaceae bacterium]|nr:MAG: signal recognition particle-docking protein FtsY [Nevskiaceae bacterium]TBR73162.1 MAG: signal recognition particle-docking protein FtsY [Nevskiaceae bacterium]